MEESPEVAIIQHASGVMQVINSFFENASKYFTICVIFWKEWPNNFAQSRILQIKSICSSASQLAAATAPLLLGITLSFAGKPSRASHSLKMELKNSGQRATSLKILTCLSVYRLQVFWLD